jgi:hypothetical protein
LVDIPVRREETARRASVLAEQWVPPMSAEDAAAMAHLTQYDDRMYQERQALKRPTDHVEVFLARESHRSKSDGHPESEAEA